MDKRNIFPVPNKWGDKGATTFQINEVDRSIVQEALLSAYNETMKNKNTKGG